MDDGGYIVGAVELAVEVAASSASYDLNDKLGVYRRNGVREYVVWRAEDGEVDWFILQRRRYVRLTPGADGIIHKRGIPRPVARPGRPGAGDMTRVDEAARLGLASPAHAEFRRRSCNAGKGAPREQGRSARSRHHDPAGGRDRQRGQRVAPRRRGRGRRHPPRRRAGAVCANAARSAVARRAKRESPAGTPCRPSTSSTLSARSGTAAITARMNCWRVVTARA